MPGWTASACSRRSAADRMPPVVFVDRLRRIRAARLRGARARLPAEAVRPRALLQHARPRARAHRAAARRRSRQAAAGAGAGPQAGGPQRPIGWSSSRAAASSSCALDEIDWIEAAGNYVRLHLNGESHLFRETMNAMEKRLDSALRPHPPLAHRQHRPHQGAAALVQRRVRRRAAERHAPHAEPRLQGPAQERLGAERVM